MGKTSRKTKAKKTDFNKVKLKVGKRKPLAANTTVTSFKSQSIYISQQMKNTSQNEVATYKNQTISDLLSHLNHFNPAFRYRALNGIKEILSNKTEDKKLDPGSIVEKVSKCMVDDDAEVRNACISTLQLIFAEVPELKMSPFFPLVLSHLYCAMSHLATNVQKDSLKVVDLFLEHYPNLVSRHGNMKLLQYFLELISMKESGMSNKGRVLDMKLSIKKESAVEWRLGVLSRIYSLLQVLSLPVASAQTVESKLCPWNSESIGIILFSKCSQNQTLLLRNFQQSNVISSSEPSSLDLVAAILPILLQCWVEVSGSGILSKDAETINTMVHVLSITISLCSRFCMSSVDKITSMNWLQKMYVPSFDKYFFNIFPIQQTNVQEQRRGVESKKRKKFSESKKVEDISKVNLLICDLFALLASSHLIKECDSHLPKFLQYLTDFLISLSSWAVLNDEYFALVMSCVKKLTPFRTSGDHQEELVSSLYQYSRHSRCNRSHKVKVLNFMMELYGNVITPSVNSSLQKLLSNLPSHFVSVLNEIAKRKKESCKMDPGLFDSLSQNLKSIVKCMHFATRRKNQNFLSSMGTQLSKVIDTFSEKYSDLFCSHLQCLHCVNFQVSIFSYTIPSLQSLSEENFKALSSLCASKHMPFESVSFLIDLLVQRIDPNVPSNDSFASQSQECLLLLKFLLSVLLDVGNESTCKETAVELTKHIEMCDHIVRILSTFCSSASDLWNVLGAFLMRKINEHSNGNKAIMGMLNLSQLLCAEKQTSIDHSHVGKFLSELLIKSCSGSDDAVNDDVIKRVIVLLKQPLVMEHCLKCIMDAESAGNVLALTKVLRIGELQENCVPHSSLVTAYIASLEKSSNSDNVRKLQVLSSLMLSKQ